MTHEGEEDAGVRARSPIVAIVSASSGNLVEWFDFYVYSFTALYFAPSFFPSGDATSQLLSTAGIFAVGFFMRPLGGWLFGRIADRHGRRTSMVASVLMMCGGSLMVACLPTHRSVGALAPFLLLVARLIQGLSVGGEYGTSATYMSEIATPERRGFYASFQYVTLIGGQLLAVVSILLLQLFLSLEELRAWGWRIPFFLGAAFALVAISLRRTLPETATRESRANQHAGTIAGMWAHRRAVLTVLGYTAGGSLSFYTFTTYMQKYLVNTAQLRPESSTRVMTLVLLVYMLVQPVFGALSDRIGRRASMLCFCVFGVVATVPLMTAIGQVREPAAAFALVLVGLCGVSFYSSISGLVKAEMFPKEVRALAVGLSYAVGNAIFGGTAEYVALWLKSVGHESLFYVYVSSTCALGLVAVWLMPDPRQHGFLRESA